MVCLLEAHDVYKTKEALYQKLSTYLSELGSCSQRRTAKILSSNGTDLIKLKTSKLKQICNNCMSNVNTFLIGNNNKCSQNKPRHLVHLKLLEIYLPSCNSSTQENNAEILWFEVRLEYRKILPHRPCPPKSVIFKLKFAFLMKTRI